MEEYFKVLLGGLFGISTIVVAVMSLAANSINGKLLNMYVNKMHRFNILFTFIPIYYVVTYCLIIMKWNWLATNEWVIIIAILGFLISITWCSYLTAQYVIDTKRFQERVLKVSLDNLKKNITQNNRNLVVVDYMYEAQKNLNSSECRIFQDTASRLDLYSKYLELIDISEIDDDNMLKILNLLSKEFGINKAFDICSDFRVGQLTFILLSSIDNKTDINVIKLCVERVHAYFLYQLLVEGLKYERYKEIVILNKKNILLSRNYFEATLQYLYETKFVIKDAFYLSNILRQLYDIEEFINIDELNFDNTIVNFYKELIETKNKKCWDKNGNGNEKDQAIQTALIMLWGGENEREYL